MFLNKIVQVKHEEISQRKLAIPLVEVRNSIQQAGVPRKFIRSLRACGEVRVIAEIKKASPSKGVLCNNFDPLELARNYQDGGAAALSVLTDESFFQGSLSFLQLIKKEVALPLLRKDFIIDSYQIFESRAAGADAILLIARLLSPDQLAEFLRLTKELGMAALVEVHDLQDLEKSLAAGAILIGINNRDLSTFKTELQVTRKLASKVPKECVLVSESGISEPSQLAELRSLGVNAVLVGEALVKQADVTASTLRLVSGGK